MNPSAATQDQVFQIGEHVRLRRVYQDVDTIVVEDRGHLGPGGKRVYRVRVLVRECDGDQRDFEVLVDDLRRLDATLAPRPAADGVTETR